VTAYTVTATGPDGPAAQLTVAGLGAVVGGLSNFTNYTITVAAANPAAAGNPSGPTTPAAPAAQDVSAPGDPVQLPPALTEDNTYLERFEPVISGDGRYVFYLFHDDRTDESWELHLVRYDLKTTNTVVVSVDGQGNEIPLNGSRWPRPERQL
jgi:hypothetical protein